MKKSVFSKISNKNAANGTAEKALYKIRHYSNAKILPEESELIRGYVISNNLIEQRDSLNNADYWLIGALFNLKDERSL